MSAVSIIASTQPSVTAKSGQSTAKPAVATTLSQSSANVSGSVTISQAGQVAAQASSISGGAYDFTNMTPNQMGQLISDGKITGGFMVITPAQLRIAGEQASGIQVSQSEIDAANNTPANYIQLYTKGISDSKMYGIDTTGMESILRQMEALQGATASSPTSA